MEFNEIKEIAARYADIVRDELGSDSSVYIFGSYVHGMARKGSDIDVAVVSSAFDKNYDENRLKLWKLRRRVSSYIEPHGFRPVDFEDNANPLAYEIRKTGVRIV